MLPNFLLPEIVARKDGAGTEMELAAGAGRPVLLTLGITNSIEQESLDVAIHGSADGQAWTDKPLLTFPQKFYCGTYTLLLDLSGHPEVRYLRVQWKMSRWGRGEPTPLFGFYLFAQHTEMAACAVA